MEFDANKVKAFYEELIAKRDEAIDLALVDKDIRIQERFDEVKAEIEVQVIAEITAEAEIPFKSSIELCEKFMADETDSDVVEAEEEIKIEEI